jgi:response regulator RpfG family c-di-GMP phosphodiesterase
MILFSLGDYEKAVDFEKDVFSFWNKLLFAGIDLDFPWLNYFLVCLNYRYNHLTKNVHTEPDSETKENLAKILETAITMNKLYHKNKEMYSAFGGTRYDFILWESQFLSGLISFGQLHENIQKRQAAFAPDDYSPDAMYVNLNLSSYLCLYAAKMQSQSGIRNQFLSEISRKAIQYMSLIPLTVSPRDVTESINTFTASTGIYLKPMEQLDFIIKMTTFRHIPTYAHSIMVGKIAVCLTHFLVEKSPDKFIGCMDFTTVEEVRMQTEMLYDFAETCGLCHDIGKISYASNPFMKARILTDDEYEIVRAHPQDGINLLARDDDAMYSGYTDVIMGHHKYYDNSGGYPAHFNINESKHRMMIDIIKAADAIDAATDEVGKTYGVVKSLDQVFMEIKAESGTQYSPVVAELLSEPDVIAELGHIVHSERKKAYYTAYTQAWS